jgi:hypothetical protein
MAVTSSGERKTGRSPWRVFRWVIALGQHPSAGDRDAANSTTQPPAQPSLFRFGCGLSRAGHFAFFRGQLSTLNSIDDRALAHDHLTADEG